MYNEGVHKKTYLKGKWRKKVGIYAGTLVWDDEVDYYLNDTFYSALEAWWFTKKFKGPPNGQGWYNENVLFKEAYATLESESDAIQKEEMDERQNNMEKAKSSKGKESSNWTTKKG